MKGINIFCLLIFWEVLVASCTDQITKIELVSSDANYNIGEIDVSSSVLSGKGWLIQNVGNSNLRIDSVELSCNCLKAIYDSVNTIKPNSYFSFKVLVTPDGALGDFYREIRIFGNFENSPLELSIEGTFIDCENKEKL